MGIAALDGICIVGPSILQEIQAAFSKEDALGGQLLGGRGGAKTCGLRILLRLAKREMDRIFETASSRYLPRCLLFRIISRTLETLS